MSCSAFNSSQLMELLVADSIDQCDAATVDHVDQCVRCRTELERLAADETWWSDGKTLLELDEPPASSSQVLAIHDDSAQSLLQRRASNDSAVDRFLQPAPHPELMGQLGKYQIESVIGRGGMGIVFRGFDTELHRTVAIKVLAPHLATSGAARQRFSREARAAAAVVHDHVVAIHGIETDSELPYIVMPFISGESLHSYVVRQGPLDVRDIVRIAMQIAAGLSAAHEQGLVHRDIKPANILLENGFGRVLITDFGLARAADDASITRSGLVAGTPHYMSPEQANGDNVDHRSDLFSLGGVIFFMATGIAPFRGEGAMAVLNAICHRDPKSVCEVNNQLPPQLEVLVSNLLQKNADERFESAASLRSTLADYLAHLQNPSKHALPARLKIQAITTFQKRMLIGTSITLLLCATLWLFVGVIGPFLLNSSSTGEPVQASVRGGMDAAQDATQEAVYGATSTDDMVITNSPLDQQTYGLMEGLREVRREWAIPRVQPVTQDGWEQAMHFTQDRFRRVEQEWSTRPME